MMLILKAVSFALLTGVASATPVAPKSTANWAADIFSNGIGAYGAPMPRTDQLAGGSGRPMRLAQVEVQIPSATQLDRMEREDIATPPLDVSGSPVPKGSEQTQIRRMDRQDRIIDNKVMRGICSDC